MIAGSVSISCLHQILIKSRLLPYISMNTKLFRHQVVSLTRIGLNKLEHIEENLDKIYTLYFRKRARICEDIPNGVKYCFLKRKFLCNHCVLLLLDCLHCWKLKTTLILIICYMNRFHRRGCCYELLRIKSKPHCFYLLLIKHVIDNSKRPEQ